MGQEAFAASNLGYLARAPRCRRRRRPCSGGHGRGPRRRCASPANRSIFRSCYVERAAYTLAGGGDTDEAVADLREAVHVATEQGARVARLRAALELARLPESLRPKGWRIMLEEARSDMPASFVSDEIAVADDLLAG